MTQQPLPFLFKLLPLGCYLQLSSDLREGFPAGPVATNSFSAKFAWIQDLMGYEHFHLGLMVAKLESVQQTESSPLPLVARSAGTRWDIIRCCCSTVRPISSLRLSCVRESRMPVTVLSAFSSGW